MFSWYGILCSRMTQFEILSTYWFAVNVLSSTEQKETIETFEKESFENESKYTLISGVEAAECVCG